MEQKKITLVLLLVDATCAFNNISKDYLLYNFYTN